LQQHHNSKEHPGNEKHQQGLSLFTIGHSKRSIDEFLSMLKAHGIEQLVDVRRFPGSRRVPQFNRDSLAESLRAQGLAYAHLPNLGGMREPRSDSPNIAWRNAAFRGYADHMATQEFRSGVEKLMELARAKRTAIMCAEAVPWRCHRSLLSDALIARGVEVEDIMSEYTRSKHELTPFAKISENEITYPSQPNAAIRRRPVTSKRAGSSVGEVRNSEGRRATKNRKQSQKISPAPAQQTLPGFRENSDQLKTDCDSSGLRVVELFHPIAPF
jgi:hypothetical protein